MGNPIKYYKRALQEFAYLLNNPTDYEKARKLIEEENEEVLKANIWNGKINYLINSSIF